jgi:ribosomal protein S27AE
MRRSHLTFTAVGMDKVIVKARCPRCKDDNVFMASFKGIEAWENGELIQRALPNLTAEQREFLMTGYDQKCWDEMFADEEDEEYEES